MSLTIKMNLYIKTVNRLTRIQRFPVNASHINIIRHFEIISFIKFYNRHHVPHMIPIANQIRIINRSITTVK